MYDDIDEHEMVNELYSEEPVKRKRDNQQKFDNIVVKPADIGEYSMKVNGSIISKINHIYNSIPKDKKLPAFIVRKFDYSFDFYRKIFIHLGDIPHFYKNPDKKFFVNYYQYSLISEKINNEMLTINNFNKIYNKNPYRNQTGRCQYRLKNVIPLYNQLVHKYATQNDYQINTDKVYKENLEAMLIFIRNFINKDINHKPYFIEKYENDFKLSKLKVFNKIKEKIKTPGDTLGLICTSDDITIEELRIVAIVNGIKNSNMMTKQQLCGEFKKIIDNNKNKMDTAICNNDTNMLGDDIKSIPSSNFIDYEENGVSYCFDVVEIVENKVDKNPYTRSKFSDAFMFKVYDQYNNLVIDKQVVEENITDLLNKVLRLNPYIPHESYVNATDEQLYLYIELLNGYYEVNMPKTNDKKEILKNISSFSHIIDNYTSIDIHKYVFTYWNNGKKLETLRGGFIYPTYLTRIIIGGGVRGDPIYDLGENANDDFPQYVDNYTSS